MKGWVELAFAVAFNVWVLFCLWSDVEDGYEEAQHEAQLDELWGDEEWAA